MDDKIEFSKFAQLDLRVGTIIKVEVVEKSDKLYRLLVDIGQEKPRQIVAGLRKFYQQDQLLNKQVVVVANLQPKTIFGLLSQGMLLAANDDQSRVSLLVPDKNINQGSKIR